MVHLDLYAARCLVSAHGKHLHYSIASCAHNSIGLRQVDNRGVGAPARSRVLQDSASASLSHILHLHRHAQHRARTLIPLFAAAPHSGQAAAALADADSRASEEQQKALQKVATNLAKSGNVAGALTLLEALQHEFPANAHYRFAAANLLAQQGDRDAARQLAAEAAAAQPNDPTHMQVRMALPANLASWQAAWKVANESMLEMLQGGGTADAAWPPLGRPLTSRLCRSSAQAGDASCASLPGL